MRRMDLRRCCSSSGCTRVPIDFERELELAARETRRHTCGSVLEALRKTIETTPPTDGQLYASLCTGEKTIPDNFIAGHVSLPRIRPSTYKRTYVSVRACLGTHTRPFTATMSLAPYPIERLVSGRLNSTRIP